MKLIGILGAGHIGKPAATRFLANDFQVLISNRKGPETLTDIVSQLGTGAKAVTAVEAAAADIILVAVPWTKVKDLTELTDWNGKIVIDATNRLEYGAGIEDGGLASSEVVQNYLPGAKVVKAMNTLSDITKYLFRETIVTVEIIKETGYNELCQDIVLGYLY
jgi:predicted dinucleotide-binding enzyme